MASVGAPAFPWTAEIEDEILNRIAGGEAVADICGLDRDQWLPGKRTFYARLSDDAEFAHRYARAREVQAHGEADEIRAIADAATVEDVQVARLKIDARKWRAAKMAPKVYGDKSVIEGPGPNGEHTIETKDTSPVDLARRIAFALAKGVEESNG